MKILYWTCVYTSNSITRTVIINPTANNNRGDCNNGYDNGKSNTITTTVNPTTNDDRNTTTITTNGNKYNQYYNDNNNEDNDNSMNYTNPNNNATCNLIVARNNDINNDRTAGKIKQKQSTKNMALKKKIWEILTQKLNTNTYLISCTTALNCQQLVTGY